MNNHVWRKRWQTARVHLFTLTALLGCLAPYVTPRLFPTPGGLVDQRLSAQTSAVEADPNRELASPLVAQSYRPDGQRRPQQAGRAAAVRRPSSGSSNSEPRYSAFCNMNLARCDQRVASTLR